MKILAFPSLRLRARLIPALGAAALIFLCGPVWADEAPFDLESSSWMSFDRYKDKPTNWLTPDKRAEVTAQPVVIAPPTLPASMPQLTEPTRPVIAPVMPGLNKNFDIRVDSTADDHRLPVLESDNADKPAADLPDSNWKNAADAARNSKSSDAKTDDSNNPGSFNVRYSALPPWLKTPPKKALAMTPVPAPTLASVKIAPPIAPPPPPQAPAISPADVAACAALDAYKKRQLQAIESDRQTLTALQTAISQLGLQKQLDFMPGVGGSLNAQAGPSVTVPVTSPAAKN